VAHGWHKLDCLSVVWEREDDPSGGRVRCLMGDASLKLYNYFCIRECSVQTSNLRGDGIVHAWDARELQGTYRYFSYKGKPCICYQYHLDAARVCLRLGV
jgi:hypothetical protein